MYRSFYGLKRKPFQMSTNPSFVWLGDTHKEVLALFTYGILESQGILLLTGDVGTGKTTLINTLANSLDEEFIVGKVPDPGMDAIDFMNYLSNAFHMQKKFVSKDAFLIHFDYFLNSAYSAGKKVLLIIDEAQRLSPDLLEEVRQLSNIENRGMRLLNIILIGQNELSDVLQGEKNRALCESISINYVINPLDVHETAEFISHRLKIAGTDENIFDPDAILEIQEFSGGFPRRINIIGDYALVSGFYQGVRTITGAVVRKCVNDLRLPGFSGKPNPEFIKAVRGLSSRHPEAIPPKFAQEISSRRAGFTHVSRTVGIVFLSAIVAFSIAYFNSPGEYRDLLYRFKNNGQHLPSLLLEPSVSDSINSFEADTTTTLVNEHETQSEMLSLGENSMELSVENDEHVRAFFTDKSTGGPGEVEVSAVLTYSDNFQSVQSPKVDIAGDVNFADKVLDLSFPSGQQALIAGIVTEERPISSETAAVGSSVTGTVHDETEKPPKIALPEGTVLAVDSSDAENENRYEEYENTTVDPAVYSAIEESMTQNRSNDVADEPVELAKPQKVEEVLNGASGNIDPSAVIDWVIKDRSK